MTARRPVTAVACLTLLLAACGQGNQVIDGQSSTSSSSSTASSATTETSTSSSDSSSTTTTTSPSSPASTGSSTSTGTTTTTTPAPTSAIDRRLSQMSLREKAGQVMVLEFAGTTAPTDLIDEVHPGGLIYFSENLTDDAQVLELSRESQAASSADGEPLMIMTDEEGGLVSRMPGLDEPAGAELDGDVSQARSVARDIGQHLRRLGLDTDLAPVADVNTVGDAGVIGSRSFGSTPSAVSPMVRAQVCGFHRGGVAAAAKHFPGHGSSSTDSHAYTAEIDKTMAEWRQTDLPPFRAAVKADVDMILVGHLAYPKIDPTGRPASISRKLNHQLIRGTLGFRGVVITDALNMGGVTRWGSTGQIAVKTLAAGSDVLLMPPSPSKAVRAIVRAVRSGRLPESRLDDAVRHVLIMKQHLGLYGGDPTFSSCSPHG